MHLTHPGAGSGWRRFLEAVVGEQQRRLALVDGSAVPGRRPAPPPPAPARVVGAEREQQPQRHEREAAARREHRQRWVANLHVMAER